MQNGEVGSEFSLLQDVCNEDREMYLPGLFCMCVTCHLQQLGEENRELVTRKVVAKTRTFVYSKYGISKAGRFPSASGGNEAIFLDHGIDEGGLCSLNEAFAVV